VAVLGFAKAVALSPLEEKASSTLSKQNPIQHLNPSGAQMYTNQNRPSHPSVPSNSAVHSTNGLAAASVLMPAAILMQQCNYPVSLQYNCPSRPAPHTSTTTLTNRHSTLASAGKPQMWTPPCLEKVARHLSERRLYCSKHNISPPFLTSPQEGLTAGSTCPQQQHPLL
jgi:hypothetical protein